MFKFSNSKVVSLFAIIAFVAANSFAGFAFHRDRDADLFKEVVAKPFKADKDVVVVVMREGIPRGGGYVYQYPRENPEPVMTDEIPAMEGDLSMRMELVANDYSGIAVCIAGSADLSTHLEEGVLEFWIRGEQGGEKALYVLVDDGTKSNGNSLQVKIGSASFGEITKEWKKVVVPLKVYGHQGVYWDEKNQMEVQQTFNWTNFKGFRMEIRKDANESFKVWIDDVVIKKVGPAYEGPSGYPYRNEL